MDSLLRPFARLSQSDADVNVYVADNPSLCLTTYSSWVSHSLSYLEYAHQKVSNIYSARFMVGTEFDVCIPVLG